MSLKWLAPTTKLKYKIHQLNLLATRTDGETYSLDLLICSGDGSCPLPIGETVAHILRLERGSSCSAGSLCSLHLGYACVQGNLVYIIVTHCSGLEMLKFGMATEFADYNTPDRLFLNSGSSHNLNLGSGSFKTASYGPGSQVIHSLRHLIRTCPLPFGQLQLTHLLLECARLAMRTCTLCYY